MDQASLPPTWPPLTAPQTTMDKKVPVQELQPLPQEQAGQETPSHPQQPLEGFGPQ